MVIDCRSREKISKFDLLALMKKEFGLIYKISKFDFPKINNLNKKNYYSMMSNDRKLGFNPKYSSEESLVKEVKKLITMNAVK
jgi:nucleoside-diphosphate-sugar epimerase